MTTLEETEKMMKSPGYDLSDVNAYFLKLWPEDTYSSPWEIKLITVLSPNPNMKQVQVPALLFCYMIVPQSWPLSLLVQWILNYFYEMERLKETNPKRAGDSSEMQGTEVHISFQSVELEYGFHRWVP